MNVMILCNELPPNVVYDKTEPWFKTSYAVVGAFLMVVPFKVVFKKKCCRCS